MYTSCTLYYFHTHKLLLIILWLRITNNVLMGRVFSREMDMQAHWTAEFQEQCIRWAMNMTHSEFVQPGERSTIRELDSFLAQYAMSAARDRQVRDGLQSSMPIGQPALSPAWYDAIAPWSNARQTDPADIQHQRG